MSRKFLTNIDLNGNQLLNVAIQNLASDPGSPATGQFWFNTTSNLFKWYNGTIVIDPLARANHSGTQLASTISNLAATVQAYTLDQFAAPAANISLNSNRITNLSDPIAGSDAATKNYVDASIVGLSWKDAVAAATTANITLSGTQTIDTYAAQIGDRVLVKNQTTVSQNGIYVVASGAWSRSADMTTSAQFSGAAIFVDGGAQAGSAWTQTAVAPTVGTTSIVFTQFGGGSVYTAGSGLTLTGNQFSVGSGQITNVMLANSSITVANGTGISVSGSPVSLGGTVTVTNTGVTSNVAGTGISVSSGTGAVTISNTGVTSIVAGTNVSISGGTGAVTVNAAGTQKYAMQIGDGSSTSYTVTHNLGSKDVIVSLRQTSGDVEVEADITHTTNNTITVAFAVAPLSNAISVVVIG